MGESRLLTLTPKIGHESNRRLQSTFSINELVKAGLLIKSNEIIYKQQSIIFPEIFPK